jgi:hypothetical protein
MIAAHSSGVVPAAEGLSTVGDRAATKATGHLCWDEYDLRIPASGVRSENPERSWREERPNSNSESQQRNDRHQGEHDQDPAVHQMVVPLRLAVPQLVPRFFLIVHRVIFDWKFLRQASTHPDLADPESRGHSACPKRASNTGKQIFLRMFRRHFPVSGLVIIVFAR